MSRIARVALEGVPYHVTQRGNGRQQIFFSDADYRLYLDLLRKNSQRYHLRVQAYCLMPNHVHFVAVPERPDAMAKTFGRSHSDYARHFNLQRGSCGHVWQARFFSCPLDRQHLQFAIAYVERNPVVAGLVRQASDYPWSSAAAHTGEQDTTRLLDLSAWRDNTTGKYQAERLKISDADQQAIERLREATQRGRPFGAPRFIEELEQKADRRLRPLPTGRPKKNIKI